MRYISPDILAAANNATVQEPCAFVDIYSGPEKRVAIDSKSQFIGNKDPMKASDSNVSFTNVVGAATLANGSLTAPVYGGSPAFFDQLSVIVPSFSTSTIDYHREIPFKAAQNLRIDSVLLRLSLQDSLFFFPYFVTAKILDSNGQLVGNASTNLIYGGVANYTFSGLNASLLYGNIYSLSISIEIHYSIVASGFVGGVEYMAYYTLDIYEYSVASSTFIVPTSAANVGFSLGGYTQYAASGSFTRQFKMGASIPSGNGIVKFSDIVPASSSMVVTLYYTDNAAYVNDTNLTNFTSFGVVASGDVIPPHRFWRAKVDFTSTTLQDDTPQLLLIEINYKGAPVTFGTHTAIVNGETIYGTKCLESVSASSSKMNPKISSSIIGEMNVVVAPLLEANAFFNQKIRGKLAVVKFGYVINGSPVTDIYYQGVVKDYSWDGSKYTLVLTDDLNIADVQLPTDKQASEWSSATTYNAGDKVLYGTNTWESTSTNTNVTPGTTGDWTNIGLVWQPIVYDSSNSPDTPSDWHLADIAEDILTNKINIPSERIDFNSLSDIKTYAANANVRGSRAIYKPIPMLEALAEIAWLLRAQWVMRQGKIALVMEDTPIVGNITDTDIKGSASYRRGYAELKNACLILSGYIGEGDGNENFLQSYVQADATSIADYDMVGLEVFKDKWSVPATELDSRALDFETSWKNGRAILSYQCAMRNAALEVGDVVSFYSKSLPPSDTTTKNCLIIGCDLDWMNQSIKHTLLEIPA